MRVWLATEPVSGDPAARFGTLARPRHAARPAPGTRAGAARARAALRPRSAPRLAAPRCRRAPRRRRAAPAPARRAARRARARVRAARRATQRRDVRARRARSAALHEVWPLNAVQPPDGGWAAYEGVAWRGQRQRWEAFMAALPCPRASTVDESAYRRSRPGWRAGRRFASAREDLALRRARLERAPASECGCG